MTDPFAGSIAEGMTLNGLIDRINELKALAFLTAGEAHELHELENVLNK